MRCRIVGWTNKQMNKTRWTSDGGGTYVDEGSLRLIVAVVVHELRHVMERRLERPERILLDGHGGQADDQNQRRLHLLRVPQNDVLFQLLCLFVLFCFVCFFAKRGGTTHLGGRWRMMSLGRRMIVLSIWCSYLYRLGWRPRWRRTIKIQLTLMIRAYHSRHSSAAWPIQVVFCSVLSVEYFFAAHRLIRLRRRVIVHRIHSLAAIVIHFGPYLFRAIT